MPPILKIDAGSEVPIYRQITDALRLALVQGEIHPGDTLPPIRQLATDLGVHFNTVAEAYRQLAEEGWLDLKRRRGAVVVERSLPAVAADLDRERFARGVRELIAKMRSAGFAPDEIRKELRNALSEMS